MRKNDLFRILFSSYYLNPDVKFESQNRKEFTVLIVRAHLFTQILWMFNLVVFLLVIFILNKIFYVFLTTSQILFLNAFGMIIIFAYLWLNFLNWFFNVGIITNKRVIDIDFYYVTYKEITSARLNKVQDITTKSGGFFDSLFNYGDVYIETAGSEPNIEFLDTPNPNRVREIISKLVSYKEKEK